MATTISRNGRARGTVVVSAALAQRPGYGGHTWAVLQYVLGLRRLGWDAIFVDRLIPSWCADPASAPGSTAHSQNLRYFLDVMKRFELEQSFCLLLHEDESLGLSRSELIQRLRRSEALLDVMGYLADDDELLEQAPNRVFLDIDPGFGQMWSVLGLADLFTRHHHYVTVGSNVGREACPIPRCGQRWFHIRPPVLLDQWTPQPLPSGPASFTTVASWRGPFDPIDFDGTTYGLRAHEFRRFFGLPRATRQHFELALDIDVSDSADVAQLHEHGWTLCEPQAVADTPDRYRRFVRRSTAELCIAKHLYVATNSGWFSDRSVCYLATGRPVVAQDTGFSDHIPTGKGLLSFTTLDEAAAATMDVAADPTGHARAARELAEAYFDSDLVLTQLLEQIGVGP